MPCFVRASELDDGWQVSRLQVDMKIVPYPGLAQADIIATQTPVNWLPLIAYSILDNRVSSRVLSGAQSGTPHVCWWFQWGVL